MNEEQILNHLTEALQRHHCCVLSTTLAMDDDLPGGWVKDDESDRWVRYWLLSCTTEKDGHPYREILLRWKESTKEPRGDPMKVICEKCGKTGRSEPYGKNGEAVWIQPDCLCHAPLIFEPEPPEPIKCFVEGCGADIDEDDAYCATCFALQDKRKHVCER
jgi:hypothetical protein